MGTPNNPPQRSAADVLRDIVRNPKYHISEADARATGMDIEILAATFEANIKPYLDYLAGYKPLEDLDPLAGTNYRVNYDRYDGETWQQVLERHGQIGQHSQCLTVFHSRLDCYDDGLKKCSNVRVGIYLTRSGKWLLWYAEGRSIIPKTERLLQFKDVFELWEYADRELQLGRYKTERRTYDMPKMLPMWIVTELCGLLDTTIEERQKRLTDMKEASAIATKRMGIITY